MLHTETVAKDTLDLIKRLSGDEIFKDFTLVGGTALALQIGHRISVDIDLFSKQEFKSKDIVQHLKNNYPVDRIETIGEKNNIAAFINKIKVDAIAHPYRDVNLPITIEGVRMASLDDIAAMKINVVYNLGNRYKDFLDIYHLLEHKSMDEMLNSFKIKYPEANELTAKMALGYHTEVEPDNTFKHLRKDVAWEEISNRVKWALKQPGQIFKMTRNKQSLEGPNQRLRRRRGRGH